MGSLLDAPMEHHQALSFASPSLATIRCDTILMYVAGRHCTVGRCKQGGTEERRTRVARTRLQLGCARVRRSSVPSILLETFPDF